MKRKKYPFRSCCDHSSYPGDMGWMSDFNNNKLSALEILKIRYARGEIDKEEYDKLKKEIQ